MKRFLTIAKIRSHVKIGVRDDWKLGKSNVTDHDSISLVRCMAKSDHKLQWGDKESRQTRWFTSENDFYISFKIMMSQKFDGASLKLTISRLDKMTCFLEAGLM